MDAERAKPKAVPPPPEIATVPPVSAAATAPATGSTLTTAPAAAGATAGAELQRLGRYQLEREIGRGAMGIVYLGRDTAINRMVAIKAIPLPSEFTDPELVQAPSPFFPEPETATPLNHPNTV